MSQDYEFHEIANWLPMMDGKSFDEFGTAANDWFSHSQIGMALANGQECEGCLVENGDDAQAMRICKIWPSAKYPGFYYLCSWSSAEPYWDVATRRPMAPAGIVSWLGRNGMSQDNVEWSFREWDGKEHDPTAKTDNIKNELTTIYFIEAVGTGCVKIGRGANRLSSLQTGCPFELKVLATTFGPIRLESELHRRFAEHRVRGEWFVLSPAIQAYIRDMARR